MFRVRVAMPSIALVVCAGVALAACNGSAAASPSPSPAPPLDPCLIGTWTVVAQDQNSPANDENITYRAGQGEVFTIDANGGVTIDTHAARPIVFDSAGETFTATVAGTGKGTLTTTGSGSRLVFSFTPAPDDTRTTHSVDSSGAELGPARPDTPFSAVYTCAPGRFTFYKTIVSYMVDGPIVTLKSGVVSLPSIAPPAPSPAASG
jgi:hypothetical protein